MACVWLGWERNQDKLQLFAEWIDKRDDSDTTGYVESGNDAEHLATTVLWRGAATAGQEAVLADGRDGVPSQGAAWP